MDAAQGGREGRRPSRQTAARCPVTLPNHPVAHAAQWLQAAPGAPARCAMLAPQRDPEITMPYTEAEIHRIVVQLRRAGYAALSAAQRKIVDSLMAVC